ncbi:hypothetical protein MGN70_010369 [Eutypa lata]|nr:hypothetical protein MGN70_010369 [Eutypa lata]
MASNQQRTILITGATGYVGGQIVREALSKGYHVRIAARTTTSASKVTSDFPEHASQLSTVIVPDITKAESFEEAFTTGTNKITGVIHTASPFVLAPEDNVRDLLEPAIRGSVAILEAAKRWGSDSVRAVVATSSFASIVDIGLGKRPGYTYTEADWNPMTYEEAARADGVTAYCASKALAERAMWDWMATNKPPFALATICPPWVFGPYARAPKSTAHLSESVSLLWNITSTKTIPPFDFGGYADAREVAAAHVLALETEGDSGQQQQQQRFLVGQQFRYQTAVDLAREKFPALGLPRGVPGEVEPAYAVDGSKAARVLGLKYGDLGGTVGDMFGQLLEVSRREEGESK